MELWLQLVTVICSTIGAVTSIVGLYRIKDVHVSLNSRLSELVRSTHAQGVLQGAQEERQRTQPGP